MRTHHTAFDPNDARIKREILMMIVQYLEENGLHSSSVILRNEACFQDTNDNAKRIDLRSIRDLLISKKWNQIDSIQMDEVPPRLIYAVYRHRFLELLVSGNTHDALAFLSGRLRPFRAFEDQAGDFDQLCFLLVDACSPSRSLVQPDLAASLQRTLTLLEAQIAQVSFSSADHSIPSKRLIRLLQQAGAYQLGKYPLGTVRSLITDYVPALLPGVSPRLLQTGHTGNIKSLAFVPGQNLLLSGGSDAVVCVWDVAKDLVKTSPVCKLVGHKARIWEISCVRHLAATASGDGTVKLWDVSSDFKEIGTCQAHEGDVYTVDLEASGKNALTGGFDKKVITWDLCKGIPLRIISGHHGAVTGVCYDSSGNMAVTGGKDRKLCIWDLRSDLCLRTLTPILGEISSVCTDQSFTRILAGVKNSTNRLWDLRMAGKSLLMKGHHNFSRSFVRARFGPDERTVIGGSDDGRVYVWDVSSGVLVERLEGHCGGVLDMVNSPHCRVFASCGGSEIVRIWEEKQMK
jgi:WD40 repeat protein